MKTFRVKNQFIDTDINNEILEKLHKTIDSYKNKTLRDIFISFGAIFQD